MKRKPMKKKVLLEVAGLALIVLVFAIAARLV
jgi:hypothetical protein